MKDYIGDELPEGYQPWRCSECDVVCNFEAMYYCVKRTTKKATCGFDRDKPESNGGCFGFMTKQQIKDKQL